MDLKDTYNRIAEDWFKGHREDDWWISGTDKFVSLLRPGALILDAGCGPGVKSTYLLKKGLNVIGVDFAEKMIEIAKREIPQTTFYVMDIEDLSGLKETFSGIFAQAVLLHVPKAKVLSIIEKLQTKLNDGGYFYVAVKGFKSGEKDEEIVTDTDNGYKYERFFSYFTLPEIKKCLTDSKMDIVYEDITRSGKTDWIQVIAKKNIELN